VIELISAELLRLRTVRSYLYAPLAFFAVFGLMAGVPLLDPKSTLSAPSQVTDNLLMLLQPIALVVAVCAATYVGGEFKRGTAAMTYLAHPNRARVTAAQLITWAAACCLLAAALAALIVGLGLSAASADHVNSGLSSLDIARVIGGAAFGGAVMGSAGVLAATATRNPTTAGVAFVAYNIAEQLVANSAPGLMPYLPFRLINSVMGLTHEIPGHIPGLAAAALLLAYLAILGLGVGRLALPRDLT
jgi:ABC-type transport system involved in multi-copper enzyme maturation permease subunit